MATTEKTKNILAPLDAVYRQIVEKINALVIVEGAEGYEEFIKAVNVVIARYGKKSGGSRGRRGKGGGNVGDDVNGDTDSEDSGDE